MMRKLTMATFTLLATAALLAGCAEDANYPTIRGSLDIQIDEGRTGFDFQNTVDLVSNPEDANPGCAAGGCAITYDENGDPVNFELWLDRGTAGEMGAGFRSFDLTLTEDEARVVAAVDGTNGNVSFASAGAATCQVTDLADLDGGGELGINVDCDLASLDGDEAHASAELYIGGCAAIWR